METSLSLFLCPRKAALYPVIRLHGKEIPTRNAPWSQQVREFCRGYEETLDEGIRRGFDVFFSIEQQIENDEFLVYGPDPQWLLEHPDTPALDTQTMV